VNYSVTDAWNRRRRVGRRHRGRRCVSTSQLVETRQVDTVGVETTNVLEVVEKMKALVEVV